VRRVAVALVAGNLAVLVILLVTIAFALLRSREAYAERGQLTAENLARTLSMSVAADVKQIDNALLSVTRQLSRADVASASGSREASQLVAEQRSLVPQVDAIRLTDTLGNVLNADDHSTRSIVDRDYFEAARRTPDRLVLSEPLQGRSSGKWGFVLARARTDADGRFLGIVYSNLTAEHLVDMFDDVSLGSHGAVTLRSGSLRLIARYTPGAADSNAGLGTATVSKEFQRAFDARPDGGAFISRTAVDGIERTNAYTRVHGYPLTLLVGLGTSDFYTPWKRQALEMTGLAVSLELVLLWLSLWIYRQQVKQARSHYEISHLAAEREALLDNDLVGMVKLDGRTETWHNKALATLFGYGPGELTGQPSRVLYADDESYALIGNAYAELALFGHHRSQIRMRRKDGRLIWIDLNGAKLPDGESLWLMLDISRVKESEAQARHLARHDSLTGLANRVELVEQIGRKLVEAEGHGRQLAVCYVDLDGFKAVNDRYGHDAGDRLLQEAAKRISLAVRSGDLVARLGGDEFAVVLCDLPNEAAVAAMLQRLLDSLAEPIAVRHGQTAVIGASIGVALSPGYGHEPGEMLSAADAAMYAAKRAGKNRFVIGDPPSPYMPQRSAGVWSGASHNDSIDASAAQTVTEQPAISSEVTKDPAR
jgi:diguanylate cyclase (GGDEF)-like protein/PAS domain S-box-containing protein